MPEARVPNAPVDDDPLDAPSPEPSRPVAHLREPITRLAHTRREAGASLERVVPEVQRLVRETASREGWGEPADALTARVVHWAVVAYYDEPALAHVPRFY